MDHHEHMDEIVSLNADDLQVEELEQRLEMALASPIQLASQGMAEVMLEEAGCDNFSCGTNKHNPGTCSGFSCQQF